MIIYPSIDMRAGKVVRLREGDPNRQITFSDNPTAAAQRWIDEGAQWLHMVNLDGAFSSANDNETHVCAAAKLGVKVQFGGGLRSMDDIARAIDAGVSRVVLGTIALQQPEIVAEAVARYGAESVCVGLDARDGKIATHGWQQVSDQTPIELGRALAAVGVVHALYTDVSRDGSLSGVNVGGTAALARATGLHVIASGGVGGIADIRALKRTGAVAGAVIGMALYQGQVTLREALLAADEETS